MDTDSSSTASPPALPPGEESFHEQSEDQNRTPSSQPETNTKPKQKRQRRSYSCGPCKILKIKCDLQIPCTSCKKFKRINRCLLQPPQPPSKQELDKIHERKKRSLNKKPKETNDFVQAYNNNSESIPSLISSLGEASSRLRVSKLQQQYDIDQQTSIYGEQAYADFESSGSIDQPIDFMSFPSTILNDGRSLFKTNNKHYDLEPGKDLINHLLQLDSQKEVELSMVDVKRIKRLLPANFNIYERFFNTYLNTIDHIYIDLQDYDEMKKQSKLIYEKLLLIDDENAKNLSHNVKFTVIELRHLSLFFLIISNGFLFNQTFDNGVSSNNNDLLLEKYIYMPKKEIIEDWIKFSKFLKTKLLSYENLTDLIYLIDWYLILKNYYTYNYELIESYLEFNNLLNYILLNNDFISVIEDSENEFYREKGVEKVSYPNTREFKLLAKYWIQIRLVENEHTFFQFKGSLLVSNQLKNSLVPHRKLLDILYGKDGSFLNYALDKFAIGVWGLFYTRSKHSTSTKAIIKHYLEIYSNLHNLLKPDILKLKINSQSENFQYNIKDVELLIMNQHILLLFIKWLSFIRVESTYFPSLRYTTYITTMFNLFNHFNLLDELSTTDDVITIIVNNFSSHYIKLFYHCLIYQGLFLYVLRNEINLVTNFKIDLVKIYKVMKLQFETTSTKLLNNKIVNSKFKNIEIFQVTLALLQDIKSIIESDSPEYNDNLIDLLFKLKKLIKNGDWEVLIDRYFGSKDNFFRYMEKIHDLFKYLSLKPDEKNIPITDKINLNDELVDNCIGDLTGWDFDLATTQSYIKHCVDPNIDD